MYERVKKTGSLESVRRRRAELILPPGGAPKKGSRIMYESEKDFACAEGGRRAELILPGGDLQLARHLDPPVKVYKKKALRANTCARPRY